VTEHSERAAEVTDAVSEWVSNDAGVYGVALVLAQAGDDEALGAILSGILQRSVEGDQAYYVARELSPADYDRVDWTAIGDRLDEDRTSAIVERSSLGTPGARALRARGRSRREEQA